VVGSVVVRPELPGCGFAKANAARMVRSSALENTVIGSDEA